jgi:hypothetical protein
MLQIGQSLGKKHLRENFQTLQRDQRPLLFSLI